VNKPPSKGQPDWVAQESFVMEQKREGGVGILVFGAIPTAVGLFALNEGIHFFESGRSWDGAAILHGSLLAGVGLIVMGVGLTKITGRMLGCLPLLVVGIPLVCMTLFRWLT
jgi:hypothetical protein